jgi:UDP-N-acetylmuramoyl-tripeptide--D-alanyl-D-alanine ligase
MNASIQELYQIYLRQRYVTTDSRKISPGCLFFALTGDNFDGNAYAGQALDAGASYAIIDNPAYNTNERTILVEDVLTTLQSLALTHRQSLSIPVIGITGTNGKTTTKELIHAVLSSQLKTQATSGNLNNHIGVPLTILGIPKDAQIAVIEMGANHPGEIAALCNISRPTHGIITNIGKAHLEGFGGFEGIIRTKTELYRFVAQNKGTLFVNADNPLLMSLSEGNDRVTYGSDAGNRISGKITGSNPYLGIEFNDTHASYKLKSKIVGSYNFENLLAAITIGAYFNIQGRKICAAIEQYAPSNSRSQAIKTKHNLVILDAYNANPTSMRAALLNFKNLESGKKMVLLGGMKELGPESRIEHLEILSLVKELNFDRIILAGPEFMDCAHAGEFTCFKDSTAALEWLNKNPVQDYTILVKGSRGSKMEVTLEAL